MKTAAYIKLILGIIILIGFAWWLLYLIFILTPTPFKYTRSYGGSWGVVVILGLLAHYLLSTAIEELRK